MAKQPNRLTIEGHRDLTRRLNQIGGKELKKEYGQVHKRIGERIIREAGGKQTNVGAGRGASMRPSASTREIQIRVGGPHRETNLQQWGVNQRWPGGMPPPRPHIIGAADDIQEEIMDMYEDGVAEVARKAGMRLR